MSGHGSTGSVRCCGLARWAWSSSPCSARPSGDGSCRPTVPGRSWGCRWWCGSCSAGLALMLLFLQHVRRREAAGHDPLVSPELFANRQMTGGLLMFFFQFLVMMGLFFAIPLYLSVALGLSAIDTGLKLLPLSVTMLLAAAGVPRFFPTVVTETGREHLARRRRRRHRVAAHRHGRGGDRGDRDRAAPADRPRHGRARLAARCRHRLGRPRQPEPGGRRTAEHRHPVRRLARDRAGRARS